MSVQKTDHMRALIDALTSSDFVEVENLGYALDKSDISSVMMLSKMLGLNEEPTLAVKDPEAINRHAIHISDAVYIDGAKITTTGDVDVEMLTDGALVTLQVISNIPTLDLESLGTRANINMVGGDRG